LSQKNIDREDILLNQIVGFLKTNFRVLRLFLYGSRASQTNRPDSDYDFVLVVPEFNKKDRYKVMSEISSQLLHKLGVEVQVWVYSQQEFDDWKDEFSSIPETALNTGKEINLG
jgi:predicted nucleotidyltransferase